MSESVVAASPDSAPFPVAGYYLAAASAFLGIVNFLGYGSNTTQSIMALCLGITANLLIAWKFFPHFLMPLDDENEDKPINRQARREIEKKEKKKATKKE